MNTYKNMSIEELENLVDCLEDVIKGKKKNRFENYVIRIIDAIESEPDFLDKDALSEEVFAEYSGMCFEELLSELKELV